MGIHSIGKGIQGYLERGNTGKGIQGYLEWGYIGKGIQGYLERGNTGKGIQGYLEWGYIGKGMLGYLEWGYMEREIWTLFSAQDIETHIVNECRLRDMDWTSISVGASSTEGHGPKEQV